MSRYAVVALLLAVVVASCLVAVSCSKQPEGTPPVGTGGPTPSGPPEVTPPAPLPEEEASESADATPESADLTADTLGAVDEATPAEPATNLTAPAGDASASEKPVTE